MHASLKPTFRSGRRVDTTAERGGFMCYLHDDGRVQDDQKDIWYQGRGIWVYAYLFNHLDPDPRWLERAQRSRDFMVTHMHRGDGTWITAVDRAGKPVEGTGTERANDIYGALFAALGLLELFRATGREEDLALARRSLRVAVERYEAPDYQGVVVPGVEASGLRAQGHSFMFVWLLGQMSEIAPDPWFAGIAEEHLDHLERHFWNAEYGISNEYLFHHYERIPAWAGRMVPGHSIEAQWMAWEAARRAHDSVRAERFARRFRRLVEMSWDPIFGGIGDTDYRVFAEADLPAGPEWSLKTMWAQTEVMVGAMSLFEASRETWAREWYERSRGYLLETMTTGIGVWRQAVDRQGNETQRVGISPYRKGNFHQPRCLMFNLLSLDRMTGSKAAGRKSDA
jgi:N-acylglucosamine 2-epimerase